MASRFNRKGAAALLASITIFGTTGAASATGLAVGDTTPAVTPSTPAEAENKEESGNDTTPPAPQSNPGENNQGDQATPTPEATTEQPTPTPSEAPAPAFLLETLPDVQAGSPVHVQLVDAHTTFTGILPQGLTLINGLLSGTPTAAGTSTFHVSATNADNKISERTFTLHITPAPTPEPTPEPTETATPTIEPTHEVTPTETPSPTPEPTHEVTPTVDPTHSATPTPTATPTHEVTPTETPSATPTPTQTQSTEPTHEVTPTTEPTVTPTPSSSATPAPTHSATPTPGASTQAPTNSDTPPSLLRGASTPSLLNTPQGTPAVDTASVVQNGRVTLSGSGFQATLSGGSEEVTCFAGGQQVGMFYVNNDGTFSAQSFTISIDPGTYTMTCAGKDSAGLPVTGTGQLTVTAAATPVVNAATVEQNGTTTISGSGFQDTLTGSDAVSCFAGGQWIGNFYVEQDGTFTGQSNTVTLDADGSPYTLTCGGQTSPGLPVTASAELTVTSIAPHHVNDATVDSYGRTTISGSGFQDTLGGSEAVSCYVAGVWIGNFYVEQDGTFSGDSNTITLDTAGSPYTMTCGGQTVTGLPVSAQAMLTVNNGPTPHLDDVTTYRNDPVTISGNGFDAVVDGGGTVSCYAGDMWLGNFVVENDGTFSGLSNMLTLPEDTYDLTCTGQTSTGLSISAQSTLTIDYSGQPTVNLATVVQGQTTTISGSSLYGTVSCYVDGGQPIGSFSADPSGVFSGESDLIFLNPNGSPYEITCDGEDGGGQPAQGTGRLTVTAAAYTPTVADATVTQNGIQNISGSGFNDVFGGSDAVSCFIDGQWIGNFPVESDGTFNAPTAPITWGPGTYTMTCSGQDNTGLPINGTGQLTVTAPAGNPGVTDLTISQNSKGTLQGSGFQAVTGGSEDVSCYVGGQWLGNFHVESDGTFSGDTSNVTLSPNGSPYMMYCGGTDAAGLPVTGAGQLTVTAPAGTPTVDNLSIERLTSKNLMGSGFEAVVGGSDAVSCYVGGQWLGNFGVGSDGTFSGQTSTVTLQPSGSPYTMTCNGTDSMGLPVTGTGQLTVTETMYGPYVEALTVEQDGTQTIRGGGYEGAVAGSGSVSCFASGQWIGNFGVDSDGNFEGETNIVTLDPNGSPYTVTCGAQDSIGLPITGTGELTVTSPSPAPDPIVNKPNPVIAGGKTNLSGSGFTHGVLSVTCFAEDETESTAQWLGDFDVTNGSFSGLSQSIILGPSTTPYKVTCVGYGDGGLLLKGYTELTVLPGPTPVKPTVVVAPGEHSIGQPVSITGTGKPGDVLEIWVGGKLIKTVTVGQDGKWSVTYTPSDADAGKTLAVLVKDITNNTEASTSLTVAGKPKPGPTPDPTPTPTPPGPTPGPTPTPTPPGPNPGPNPAPTPAPWPDNGGNNDGGNNGNSGNWDWNTGGINWSSNNTVIPTQWVPFEGENAAYTVSVPGFAPFSTVTIQLLDINGRVIAWQTVTADANGVAHATFYGLQPGVYNVVAHGINAQGQEITKTQKLCIGDGAGAAPYEFKRQAPANQAFTGVTASNSMTGTKSATGSKKAHDTTEANTTAKATLANTGVSTETAGTALAAAGLAAATGGASIVVARRNKKG